MCENYIIFFKKLLHRTKMRGIIYDVCIAHRITEQSSAKLRMNVL